MLALLLATATPMTAVDAENAFRAAAQTEGQWAAFRRFSLPDAKMFVPQPVLAHDFLAKLKEPKLPLQWWPAESYVSCDGSVAVNTGPWTGPGGQGYFTTVWLKQPDGGWKWIYDGGDELPARRAVGEPKVRRAACTGLPPAAQVTPPAAGQSDAGTAPDRTLAWTWHVSPNGARIFEARLWNGRTHEVVIRNDIAAPSPGPAS